MRDGMDDRTMTWRNESNKPSVPFVTPQRRPRVAIMIGGTVAVLVVIAAVIAFFGFGSGDNAKVVEFLQKSVPVTQNAEILEQPKEGAALVAFVPQGMSIQVVGFIRGHHWALVSLPDKRTGYVPVSSLSLTGMPKPTPEPSEIVEFSPSNDVYRTSKAMPVYIEPSIRAPQKYQAQPDTMVPSIAVSKDHIWILAATQDGDPAFLLASDLGSPQPVTRKVVSTPEPDAVPAATGAAPDTVDGRVQVKTTADLVVGDQPLTLAGIIGEGGTYAQDLQSFIDGAGGTLHCVRGGQLYGCKLPNGVDIALTALYKGDAQASDDAPAAYVKQAKAAQAAGRGRWQQH
jgi:hypothetical protein